MFGGISLGNIFFLWLERKKIVDNTVRKDVY